MNRARRICGGVAACLFIAAAVYGTHLIRSDGTQALLSSSATVNGITLVPVVKPTPTATPYRWPVRSIDTMKQSRDLAREKSDDPSYDASIATQVTQIADTGANYVAIDTPYDSEFLPFLTRWVSAARSNGLHVWFRGNWSGWEGWFGYPKINRATALSKTVAFVDANANLFQTGDIFTACPECENGGPGDPRKTGDVAGFQQFTLDEYHQTATAFDRQGKHVATNYSAMNYDVATLVYTPDFAQQMGNVVTVDHYVLTPEQTVLDLTTLASKTESNVVLGEFGAPRPDIQGTMNESEQAQFISGVLQGLRNDQSVLAINYWVNVGGSTAIWNDDLSPREAVGSITAAFK